MIQDLKKPYRLSSSQSNPSSHLKTRFCGQNTLWNRQSVSHVTVKLRQRYWYFGCTLPCRKSLQELYIRMWESSLDRKCLDADATPRGLVSVSLFRTFDRVFRSDMCQVVEERRPNLTRERKKRHSIGWYICGVSGARIRVSPHSLIGLRKRCGKRHPRGWASERACRATGDVGLEREYATNCARKEMLINAVSRPTMLWSCSCLVLLYRVQRKADTPRSFCHVEALRKFLCCAARRHNPLKLELSVEAVSRGQAPFP